MAEAASGPSRATWPADASQGITRIAMWSGPRNISTAMMRAWASRPDTHVTDEPFYAHYLESTGTVHPGREEVVHHHETEPAIVVAEQLLGPLPDGRRIHYQKHMAHHLLPDVPLDWLARVRNAFLIRDPAEMLPSLARFLRAPDVTDTGLPPQVELFERIRRNEGRPPPVVDARDVLEDPRAMLDRLCRALGVPFTDRMLSWPRGRQATDGVWAKYWYQTVEASTAFKPYRSKTEDVPRSLTGLLDECRHLYERLHGYRLVP